ncbi:MAG: YibE/F family protein [Thermacetogeniaceae bacterium]
MSGLTRKNLINGAAGRPLAATAVLIIYLILIFMFYRNTPIYHLFSQGAGTHVNYEKAEVINIQKELISRDSDSGLDVGYQEVDIRILTGEHKGQVMTVKNYLNYTTNIRARAGSAVIVCIDTASQDAYDVWIYSYDRGPFLYIFALLFIAVLCAIGGSRGLKSVLGIIFTFASIVFLFIPMLYRGYSPALAAVGVLIVTICVTLVLLGGFSPKTLSAVLGATAGVAISAVILVVALSITHLSGYSTNESDVLIQIAGRTHMKIGELLFAAILISSLGAIMDIAISIASAVTEVYAGNSKLTAQELFRSGMNVGRDMMGTMANTLIIAFTGTALNTLVLIYSWNVKYYQLLNNNLIGIYMIQAVSGSIAVILTVPLVSFIAARLIPVLAAGPQEQDVAE